MQAASPVIEQEWLGASDPLSPAAKDHQSFLIVAEKACRWVLDHGVTSNHAALPSGPPTRWTAAVNHRCGSLVPGPHVPKRK